MRKPVNRRKKPKTHQRIHSALRYYRDREKWPDRRLHDKMGRLVIRLLAADQVLEERGSQRLLSQSARDILEPVVTLHLGRTR